MPMSEEFEFNEKPASIFLSETFDWVESAIVAIACVILVFTFGARLVTVSGESMYPTLNDRDRLVSSKLLYTPKNGDIVVVTKETSRHEPLIKRVIATEGQELYIDFENNAVYVDGQIIDEPYIAEPMDISYAGDVATPVTVPEGHVFIMGDNRNNSWDSRYQEVGMVDERCILGRIVFRAMPYDSIGVPQ